MPSGMLLDYLPLWGVFAATIMVVWLAVECGYRLGRHNAQRAPPAADSSLGTMVGAMLGLLAFVLAFTFGLAAARFDARRLLVLDEANAIGTTYLRAGFLPEPHRAEIRTALREYVDARVQGVQSGKIAEMLIRSEDIQDRLWAQAVALEEKNPASIAAALFVQTLNEVIDLHTKRVTAGLRTRIPDTIWGTLYAVACLALAAVGYCAGLGGKRNLIVLLPLVLSFSLLLLLIADLDRPREGSLKVSQQALIDLQSKMRP